MRFRMLISKFARRSTPKFAIEWHSFERQLPYESKQPQKFNAFRYHRTKFCFPFPCRRRRRLYSSNLTLNQTSPSPQMASAESPRATTQRFKNDLQTSVLFTLTLASIRVTCRWSPSSTERAVWQLIMAIHRWFDWSLVFLTRYKCKWLFLRRLHILNDFLPAAALAANSNANNKSYRNCLFSRTNTHR